jgi:hypothetical protein
MAELNFGLLNPPGSQSIGNAFVQGMDQAAAARAQENQNAMAQYTLGKAKREDLQQNELYNAVRQPGFKLDIGTAMRFGAPGLAAYKAQEEAATRGVDFQIKQKTLAGLPNKQLLDESNLLDKVLDRFKGQVPNIQTPEAVAEYVRQTYADPILGPYGAKLKPLEQALTDNLAEFNANPDKWRTLHTNVSGLQILQATMPKPQVAGGNIVNMNSVAGPVGAPIAGAPTIPQTPVAKLQAEIAAAKARNAPLAETAALEQEAGRLSKLANIAGGQLNVAQGNLAVNQARLKLAQDAPKLGLVDPEDIDRVAVAIASGRVPVDKLNSTTAPMFAKLLKANPDLDFTKLSIGQAGDKAGAVTTARIGAEQTRATSLTPEMLKQHGDAYNTNGKLPSLGSGPQAAVDRVAILRYASENNPTDATTKALNKAQLDALVPLAKQETAVTNYVKTFDKNIDLARAALTKVSNTNIPALNAWLLNPAQRRLTGDPDLKALGVYVSSLQAEFAKIQSGAMGNSVTADAAIKRAEDTINTADSPRAFRAALDAMVKESRNRLDSFEDTRKEMAAKVRGQPAPTTPAAPASATVRNW